MGLFQKKSLSSQGAQLLFSTYCGICLLSIIILALATGNVAAASKVWSGGTSANWDTGGVSGNWNGAARPTSADYVTFNATSTNNRATIQNIGALSIQYINMAANPGGPVSITNSTGELTLIARDNGINCAYQDLTISGTQNIVLGDYNTWTVAVGKTLTVSTGITSSENDLTVRGAGNAVLSGVINLNSGVFFYTGTGVLTLSGSNTYAGVINVSGGTLKLGAAGGATNSPLGTIVGNTVIGMGCVLDLNGYSLGTAEPLALTGNSSTNSLTNTSSTAATYKGLINLAQGVYIGSNNGHIIISNTGTITASATPALSLTGTNTGSSIASILGTTVGTLTKWGTGTWTTSGANTYTGLTTIEEGTLNITGSIAGNVIVNDGPGTLAGNGTIAGTVTASGTAGVLYISPGNAGIGTLTITKSAATVLTTDTKTILNYELGATGASDKIACTGLAANIALASATINCTGVGFAGPGTYPVITYTGTATGTLTVGTMPPGYLGTININTGTTPKKIELVVTVDPSTTSRKLYWNPVAGSANFNTPGNWTTDASGSTPATSRTNGDTLVFSGSGTRGDTTCNMTASATCKILDFTGYIGTFNFSSHTLSDSGSATFVAGMSVTPGTGTLALIGTAAGKTLDLAGKTIKNLTINGAGGDWTAVAANDLTIAGTTTITAGTLNISTNTRKLTTAGLVINGGVLTATNGKIKNTSDFTLSSGTFTAPNSAADTMGGNWIVSGTPTFTPGVAGTVVFNAASSVSINSGGKSFTNICLCGGGALFNLLTNNLVSTGVDTVKNGTLSITAGLSISAAGGIAISSGATLQGAGTILSAVTVASGGTLAPGVNVSSIKLTSSANITLSSGALFSAHINGNANNDTLSWSGTGAGAFNLGSATLALTLGYFPTIGHTYRIVDNTSTGTYGGSTFEGLSEGAYISATYSGTTYFFTISYAGGTGSNDILLTCVASPLVNRQRAITVVHNLSSSTTHDSILIYTSAWSLVFKEDSGGSCVKMTNASAGAGTNQLGPGAPLFGLEYNNVRCNRGTGGNLEMVDSSSFRVRLRQTVTLSSEQFYILYSIYGSGKMYMEVSTKSNVTGSFPLQNLQFGVGRLKNGTVTISKKTAVPSSSPYIVLSDNGASALDIVFATFDTLEAAYIPVFDTLSTNPVVAGWSTSNWLSTSQEKKWYFLADFSQNFLTGVDAITDMLANDYKYPDSIDFILGSQGTEKAWERGLVGHWRFDEGSGTTASDFTSYANTGTITATLWTAAGKRNAALDFLGGTDVVTVPSHSRYDCTSQGFTISAWINADGNAAGTILGRWSANLGYKLELSAGGFLKLTTNGISLTGSKPVTISTWHHIAATFSNTGEGRLYLDGIVDTIKTGMAVSATAHNLLIGSSFNGRIDDVRLYDQTLFPIRVKSIAANSYLPDEGAYYVRANNDNSASITIHGSSVNRVLPVFKITNYWATVAPCATCVRLNGTALTQDAVSGYKIKFDNREHELLIGLDTVLTGSADRLYVDDNDITGDGQINPPPPVTYTTGTDTVLIKNFAGTTLGTVDSNHFALVIDKRTGTTGGCGGISWYSSSKTTPGVAWNSKYGVGTGSYADTVRPTANGTVTFLNYGGSSNWASVSEVTTDNDVTTINNESGDWATKTDYYITSDPPGRSTTIDSVKVFYRARVLSVESGTYTAAVVYSGIALYIGTQQTALTIAYKDFSNTWTTDPATSVAWTWSGVNAMKIGVRGYHANDQAQPRVTQVFAVVYSKSAGTALVVPGSIFNPVRFRFTNSAKWDSTTGPSITTTANRTVTMAESSSVRMRLTVDTVKVGGGGANITAGQTATTTTGNGDFDNSYLIAQKIILPQTAVINSFSVYVKNQASTFDIRMGIYGDNAGAPNTKKDECSKFSVSSTGWKTGNALSHVSLPAGTYWLSIWANSGNASNDYNLTSISSGDFRWRGPGIPDAALPNSWGTGALVAQTMSIYATFTTGSTDSLVFGRQYTIYPDGKIFTYFQVYKASAIDTMQPGLGLANIGSTLLTPYWDNTSPDTRVSGFYHASGTTVHGAAFSWQGYQSKALKGTATTSFVQDTAYSSTATEKKLYQEERTSTRYDAADTTYRLALYYDIYRDFSSTAQIDTTVRSILTAGSALNFITGTPDTSDFANGDLDSNAFNEAEGCWVMRASNNTVHFRLDGKTWTRYNPAFKINNYTGSEKPTYIFIYTNATAGVKDTVTLLEGYQYSSYLDRTNNRLLIQLDTNLSDSCYIYIARDPTLAVTMDGFWASGGEGHDTLQWRTESEHENSGFMLYRRVEPHFYDSLSKALIGSLEPDSLLTNAEMLFKNTSIGTKDTTWVPVYNQIIPGAKGGTSPGPQRYRIIDYNVHNDVQYQYKLVAVDFSNNTDQYEKFALARPSVRIPTEYKLGNNFPNPFRQITTIRFDLPKRSPVVLNVYTMQGRLVKKIISPTTAFRPGRYRVVWNGRDDFGRTMGAGPYVYMLVAGEYRMSRPMILMK